MLKLDLNEEISLDKHGSINFKTPSTSPLTIREIPTRAYVDSSSVNDRNNKDMSVVFNDQDKDFDKKNLRNLDSVTVNRILTSDNELAKKNFDDSLGEDNILRFNQASENFSEICFLDSVNTLRKITKTQI